MRYYFPSDTSLFRNRDMLEFDFIPEPFRYRERQLRDLAFALSPGIYGNCPFNTVIRGFPGTGKTTAIHTMFAELEKTSQRLLPVYINCQTDRTQFATFSRIYEKLHGYQPPTSGTPIRKVIHDIGSTLKERNKVLIICLDDADYLISGNVLNDLLFSLLHLYEEFPKVRIGVIISLSSMDIDLVQVLDPCVISILRPKEIYFPPYNEEEIRCILSDRINNGLYPGVMPEDLFDLVVENTMRSGDIRIGFDLVKTSVITAELAERPVVCEADVTGSYTVSKQVPLSLSIQALAEKEQELLVHIAEMSRGSLDYLTMGAVFKSVTTGRKMSYTNFSEKIRKLEIMRFINLSYITNPGRTREIALRYEAEDIMQACKKIKLIAVFSIRLAVIAVVLSLMDDWLGTVCMLNPM